MKLNLNLSKFNLIEGDEYVSVYERKIAIPNYKNGREKLIRQRIKDFNETKKFKKDKSINISHHFETKENLVVFRIKIYSN